MFESETKQTLKQIDMTISRVYAGKYEIKFKGQKYYAKLVNYGKRNEWNLLMVEPSLTGVGEMEEWCNTYPTLRALKQAFND